MLREYNSRQAGTNAEEKFAEKMVSRGCKVTPASSYQNRIEHWDFLVENKSGSYRVDVKAQKQVSRQDNRAQDEFLWIEYIGITGYNGWIQGKADFIAFEMGEGFWIISREKLYERAKSLTSERRVDKSSEALYNLYSRPNRRDLLTMIKFSDVEDLKTEI